MLLTGRPPTHVLCDCQALIRCLGLRVYVVQASGASLSSRLASVLLCLGFYLNGCLPTARRLRGVSRGIGALVPKLDGSTLSLTVSAPGSCKTTSLG